MDRLYKRLVLGIILGVLVMIAFSLYGDLHQLRLNIISFNWTIIPIVLLLTLCNYTIRFVKWSAYLKLLAIQIPVLDSLAIFMSGLMMSITPGKVGELFKSWLLKESHSIPITESAPVVVAERLTDLLALFVITIFGLLLYKVGTASLIVGIVVVALPIAILTCPPLFRFCLVMLRKLPIPILTRAADKINESYTSMTRLIAPLPLVAATILSVISWTAECLAFMLIIKAVPGVDGSAITLPLAAFVFAASTVAGIPSPGGLGLTEGGMTGLSMLMMGTTKQAAVTATILTRLCTLWFAVFIGMGAMFLFRRRIGLSSSTPLAQAMETGSGDKTGLVS